MGNGGILLKKALAEMEKEEPNMKIAFEFLSASAKAQNPEALYALGTWYLHGRFVKKKPVEAVRYFLKSIEGNNSSAYYDLAVCYEKGIGIKKNYRAAFKCYINAALSGDKQALYEVGRCYYYGIGTPKNIDISTIWLKHAELNGVC
ncbi:MAG: sel1 repeat family protein [Bacteroidetes bacterium]|nr:sel1 repeat family protein [Bacteroidota bacterium]